MKYRKKGTRQNINKELVVKKYNQPGRLAMKIQSVMLNWEVSLAMNLLGGRQRHRQRLIPTEERGLQDAAMPKITALPLFLWTRSHDRNASTSVDSTFTYGFGHSFVAWQQQVKKQLAAASIMQHSAIKRGEKLEKRHREKYSENR